MKEFYVREKCTAFACKKGFDEYENDTCKGCRGHGYVYSWVTLNVLINKEEGK